MRGQISIEIDESLTGSTVRVYYQPDVHIKVGRNATELDIQLHIGTVRTLRRYAGLTGKVRALLERIYNWIKRNGEPPVGSRAWEAKLELEKLPNIIAERQARLAAGDLDPDVRADLEAEIGDLEQQIDYHARTLDAMDTNPGVGYVAVEFKADDRNFATRVVETVEIIETRLQELPASPTASKLSQQAQELKTRNQEIIQAEESFILNENSTLSVDEIEGQKQELIDELYRIENRLFSLSANNITLNNSGLGSGGYTELKKWYEDIVDTEKLINQDPKLQKEFRLRLERQKAYWLQIPEQKTPDGLTNIIKLHRQDLTVMIDEVAKKLISGKQARLEPINKELEPLENKITELNTELTQLIQSRQPARYQNPNRNQSHIKEELTPLGEQAEPLRTQKEKLNQEIEQIETIQQRIKPDPDLEPFDNNISEQEVWKQLSKDHDTGKSSSSKKWAEVLIREGVINSDQEIIDYIKTLNPGGKTPQKIRRQIKDYYRPKLLDKTTNPKLDLQQKYQALRRVVDTLASADKGNLTETWYQKVYGKPEHLTHFEVTTADAAAQGIALQAQEKRLLDRLEGDTIVEVKTISGSLSSGGENGRSEIEQFNDNIELAKQGYIKTTSDGVKRQLNQVRYVFTLPKGVRANADFMMRNLTNEETQDIVSFEIFNEIGERKIIDLENVEQLEESVLQKWLYPISNK